MTDTEALNILRAQGNAAGAPDVHTGRVRVWIRGTDETVDVQIGRELSDLAAGRLDFADIQLLREDEAVAWTD